MTFILGIVSCMILVFIDQYTKHLAVVNLYPRGRMDFLPGFLGFVYHENAGAAFGILQGGRWFFVVFTLIVLAAVVYFYIKLPKDRVSAWIRAFMVILTAGAVGNGVDRARQGFVVDFLNFEFINFPVFNIADMLVIAGTIPLAVIILFFYKEKPKQEAGSKMQEAIDEDSPE